MVLIFIFFKTFFLWSITSGAVLSIFGFAETHFSINFPEYLAVTHTQLPRIQESLNLSLLQELLFLRSLPASCFNCSLVILSTVITLFILYCFSLKKYHE